MEVNVTTTNGILAELRAQRNDALDKIALANGQMAEMRGQLAAAQKRIKELEEAAKAELDNAVDKPAVAEAA